LHTRSKRVRIEGYLSTLLNRRIEGTEWRHQAAQVCVSICQPCLQPLCGLWWQTVMTGSKTKAKT